MQVKPPRARVHILAFISINPLALLGGCVIRALPVSL
jgi:hypothetical protein